MIKYKNNTARESAGMKYKLIAFDVDGTLYDYHDKMVHPSTINAIRAAKKAGAWIALATARSYAELSKVCQGEIGADYVIGASGQSIVDAQRRSIYAEHFTETQVERMIALCEQYDAGLALKCDHLNCLYRHPEEMRKVFGNIGESACETIVCSSRDYHHKELPVGFSIRGENGVCNQMAQALVAYPNDYRLELFHNGIVADVFLPSVSKLTALQYLCARLNIQSTQVMAFGDSINDIAMIKWAGMGIAMGNALEELKQEANFVCDPGWEDGIAKTINEILN